jgi:hypothetical protein
VFGVFLQQCALRRLAPSLGLAPPCRLGLEPLLGVVPLALLGFVPLLGLAPRLGLLTLAPVQLPHLAIAAPRRLLLEVFASLLADHYLWCNVGVLVADAMRLRCRSGVITRFFTVAKELHIFMAYRWSGTST